MRQNCREVPCTKDFGFYSEYNEMPPKGPFFFFFIEV